MSRIAQPTFVRRVTRLFGRLIIGAVVIALLLVGGTAVRVWQVAREDHRTPAESLIVLGAAQYDGVPSKWFAARLEHAAELYHSGVAPLIYTVGGKQDGDTYTEAEAGRNYLISLGVPAEAIIPVGEGSDTLQSLQAVAATMGEQGQDTAVIVTDPEHSIRSRIMASDAGITSWTSPTRTGPAVWDRSTQLHSIVRETAGLLYYQVTHSSAGSLEDAATTALTNSEQ